MGCVWWTLLCSRKTHTHSTIPTCLGPAWGSQCSLAPRQSSASSCITFILRQHFFSFKEKSENCICTFLIWAIPPSPSSEHTSAVTHIYFLTRKAYVQARGPDLPLPHPQGLRWVSLTQDPTILKKPSCISCCQSF